MGVKGRPGISPEQWRGGAGGTAPASQELPDFLRVGVSTMLDCWHVGVAGDGAPGTGWTALWALPRAVLSPSRYPFCPAHLSELSDILQVCTVI